MVKRVCPAVVVVAAVLAGGLIWGAFPAAAVSLTPTPNPLPGSMFQGGDGNQTDESPYIDWAGLRGAGRVIHTEDPNAQDDVFEGGSKESNPAGWSFTTQAGGSTPAGTNIRDMWTSVDQVGGKTFAYLAMSRQADTGTTFLTFELNRDGRTWNNGRGRIPCRREGDILITYQPHGNTANADVIVQKWHTLTTEPNGSGCAATGTLIDAALEANVDVQGSFNPAPITNLLPGSQATLGTRLWGETAVDLGKVLAGAFGQSCMAFTSVWAHSRSSTSLDANMQDVVWPRPLEVRTCAAAGTKFLDRNADGVRDAGEPGLAGAKIFADYNGNGIHDTGEPFAITDDDGNYVVDDIQRSTYTLRETTLSGTNPNRWTCSFPNAGLTSPPGFVEVPNGLAPCGWFVDSDSEPFARGRDFGNWRPAHLTVRKRVFPDGDQTQFEIVHPGGTFTLGDGDSAGGNIDLTPGNYEVSETPNASYHTTVVCAPESARVAATAGTSATITLGSGDAATCTFYNTRLGSPGISIAKTAPATAVAGDTLDYTLSVRNVGDVAFAESDVSVTDRGCDSAPRRINRGDDQTPETLEPGETWTYVCSHKTAEPTAACVAHTVRNNAHVDAGTVSGSASVPTEIMCPRPDIEVTKLGPTSAPAGSVIRYFIYVYNTGDVSFPGGGQTARTANPAVADARCDDAPDLVDKFSSTGGTPDHSPDSFDPGDVWAYSCLSTTPLDPNGCTPSTVTNTSVAQATKGALYATGEGSWDTDLTCPPPTPEPLPPGPEPVPDPPPAPPGPADEPSELPGIDPPEAGVAGAARVGRLPSCVRRGSVVTLRVSRAASVRIFVGRRPIQGLSIRALQSQVVIRVRRNLVPGRYNVTARIRFQRGAGTAPIRLTRPVRVCGRSARRAPSFTG